jgi:hypothetical protein
VSELATCSRCRRRYAPGSPTPDGQLCPDCFGFGFKSTMENEGTRAVTDDKIQCPGSEFDLGPYTDSPRLHSVAECLASRHGTESCPFRPFHEKASGMEHVMNLMRDRIDFETARAEKLAGLLWHAIHVHTTGEIGHRGPGTCPTCNLALASSVRLKALDPDRA